MFSFLVLNQTLKGISLNLVFSFYLLVIGYGFFTIFIPITLKIAKQKILI